MPRSDAVLDVLGGFGPWQARSLFLIALVKIPAAWQMMSILFLASHPETYGGSFSCARPDPEAWTNNWHQNEKVLLLLLQNFMHVYLFIF